MSIFGKLDAQSMKNFDPGPQYHVDSTSLSLNLLMSGMLNGGFKGRHLHVIGGDSQSGKSLITEKTMQNFLRESQDRYTLFCDLENAMTPERMEKSFGEFEDRFLYRKCNDYDTIYFLIDEFLSTCIKNDFLNQDIRSLIVVDPISALDKAMDKYDKDGTTVQIKEDSGRTAKAIKKFVNRFCTRINDANATMIIVGHYHTSFDAYSDPKILSGGKALFERAEFVSELSVLKGSKEEEKDKSKNVERKSHIVRAKVRKARLTKPHIKMLIPIEYEKGGFSTYGGLTRFCLDHGIIKGKSWYYWADDGENGQKFRVKDIDGTCYLENPEEMFTEDKLKIIEDKAKELFTFQE